jgi:hypothetical protein
MEARVEYVTIAGGGGGDGGFDVAEYGDNLTYILGAVFVMFGFMAMFLMWQNR